MELTGRLTENAAIKKTKNGEREFVAFTLVDNHYYKTKMGERKKEATFFSCTYWISTKIASYLTKGIIVTLSGRIGINAFKRNDGDFMANLTFSVSNIKIVGKAAAVNTVSVATTTAAIGTPETIDDLPF